MTRFTVLGAVTVDDGTGPAAVPPGIPRTILAVLLLSANTPVSTDRLAAAVWPTDAPTSYRASLRNHVMRLRRGLGTEAGSRLRTADPGYVIDVRAGELDSETFEGLCHEGRALLHDRRWTDAAGMLGRALALWRGGPPAGLAANPDLGAVLQRLAEARLLARHGLLQAELRLGRHHEAVGELRALAADHPLYEPCHHDLMLALYRANRQAEALEVYRRLRRTLVQELGIEPALEVEELHRRILRADPLLLLYEDAAAEVGGAADTEAATADTIAAAATTKAETIPAATAASTNTGNVAAANTDTGESTGTTPGIPTNPPTRPAQLPRDLSDFTGRAPELAGLLAAAAAHPADTTLVAAIDGMAGVGKSAFAVHAAHRLAGDYPDGQIHIDLHGHTPGLPPLEPAEALRTLLLSVGVAEGRIPDEPGPRAALWRSELAGRRLIVVLDNARDEAQVDPLLPGAGRHLVLVTSRRRMQHLDDARVTSLDVLDRAEALSLLRQVVGRDRAGIDPAALAEIAALCADLPLALRLVAARLRHRPSWTARAMAGRLAGHRSLLGGLDAGANSVEAAFAVSYQQLSPGQQTCFRRLGLLPGADFDPYVVAALVGVPLPEAEAVLESLLDVHLIRQDVPGRYRFHDLLRAHARASREAAPAAEPRDTTAAETAETADDRSAALRRVHDYYLFVSDLTATQLDRQRHRIPLAELDAPRDHPHLDRHATAMAWLHQERANLLAVARRAGAEGWSPHAWQLSNVLFRYLHLSGYPDDVVAVYQRALEAAEAAGSIPGQAMTLKNLGNILLRQGRIEESLHCCQTCLGLMRLSGDDHGEVATLNNIGSALIMLGRYPEAIDRLRQAIELNARPHLRVAEYTPLGNLGIALSKLGRHEEALAIQHRARAIAAGLGIRLAVGHCDNSIGEVLLCLDRPDDALDAFRRAHAVSLETGNRSSEAHSLDGIGSAHHFLGRPDETVAAHRRALALAEEAGFAEARAEFLNHLARALQAAGHVEDARLTYEEALSITRSLTNPYEQATALRGLAATTADGDAADRCLREAEEIFAALGVPDFVKR